MQKPFPFTTRSHRKTKKTADPRWGPHCSRTVDARVSEVGTSLKSGEMGGDWGCEESQSTRAQIRVNHVVCRGSTVIYLVTGTVLRPECGFL
jgi:hypothetical protein